MAGEAARGAREEPPARIRVGTNGPSRCPARGRALGQGSGLDKGCSVGPTAWGNPRRERKLPTMSLLDRVLRRDPDQAHRDWLAAHPGKDAPKSAPPEVDLVEQQRMRTQMEGELDAQRATRDAK